MFHSVTFVNDAMLYFENLFLIFLYVVYKNVVTQSRTGVQIYEGRNDQLNRPGPMA
jgi:hypothetical protein